jgi:hypothetical protein
LLFLTAFVIPPLLTARIVMPVILQTAFWLIIVAGAFNVSSRRSIRLIALTVALLSITLRWLGPSIYGKTISEVDIFFSLVMLSIFMLLMIQNFLVTGRAWGHRIAAAVAVYLLIGLIWARLYEVVELLAPGAFHIPAGESLSSAGFVYFSFVTLATLGYGDLTPVNIVARNLAVLEAITGQLYLVILISRLVSEGVAKSGKE